MSMSGSPLSQLLQVALPKPAYLSNTDGGAALALALHCLMIRDGYTVVDSGQRVRHSVYMPPSDWNGRFKDEWVFKYTKDGKANKFTLHCSLQSQSKRMFVHASEEHNINNIQILGLQLENYVPDTSKLKSNQWSGVITNETSLVELFCKYITVPLSDNAEEMVLGDVYEEDRQHSASAWYHNPYVVPAAIAATSIAAFVILYYARRAR